MNLTRRSLLTLSGSVLLAGCSSAIPETGPKYEDKDEIPSFPDEALEGDGWETQSDDEYDVVYARYAADDEIPEVGVGAVSQVAETADEASEMIDDAFEGIQREEFDLADEAYWGDDDESAIVRFRDSNAYGGVIATERSGLSFVPDTQEAMELAERWFEDW